MAVTARAGEGIRFQHRPLARLLPNRSSSGIDTALVSIPFLAILFNSIIGPLTPILILVTIPIFMLLRWERLFPIIINTWPLLLLPIFAMFSVFWSDYPSVTARYSILYFCTVLPAVLLGGGANRDSLLKGIFFAFAIYMVCSLIFGRYVSWSGPGGLAFAGLLGSKNASGDVGALTILISTAILIWGRKRTRVVWSFAALAMVFMGAFTLWQSKATGALVATIVSLPCLLIWNISRRFDVRLRVSIFVILLIVLTVIISTFDYWMPPLFEFVLESSGKDAGLTGRGMLWRKADELILQRPILGGGYAAFWVENNLDAEYLWRSMGVVSRSGFNFHNTPRDIAVDLGVVGLSLFAIVFFVSIFRLFIQTMRTPHYSSIFCCGLFVFESPRFFFELVSFQNMHFSTLIVFIILSHGMRPKID